MDDEVAVAATTGVAQVFDLHALKAFGPDKRVRKMLFKSDHPKEEEAIFVLQGTATMNIDGQEVVVPAGSSDRCVIMFIKVNPEVLRGPADG